MKRKNLIRAILISFIAFMFYSCEREDSADVNQDRIHTTYELFYNASEDKTYAIAVFRFGSATGKLLELSEPSIVKFNDDVLTFKPVFAEYKRDYAGFIESGTFKWTDTEGNTFSNTVSIETIDFPTGLDTIPRNAAFELFWVGDSLSQYHSVVVTANSVLEGDLQVFTQSNLHSKSIILALNKLQQLGQGTGTMWMDRNYKPPIIEKTGAGGNLIGRYRPINKEVYFD